MTHDDLPRIIHRAQEVGICAAVSPTYGFICDLDADHPGAHQARGNDDRVLDNWTGER